jgi:hypothetical protein
MQFHDILVFITEPSAQVGQDIATLLVDDNQVASTH